MKFFLLSLLLTHSVRAEDRRFIFERPLMGTIFTITCHGPDKASANAAADAAFQRASEINAVASDYIADSEMLKLSGKTGQSNAISPSLFDLLQRAMHFARLTDGSFDPTLGPLTKLWRETRRNGKLPTSSTLESAKNASGYRLLTLDPTASTVNLTRSGMRLDLGGIAKGYAADAMFEAMKSRGFPATCIAAGGDLRLGDPPPEKTAWMIGIKNSDKETISEQVALSNCAVSTSGDLQQYVEIDGVRYSHIVNPATGLGLINQFVITVIAADATTSDALATAACVAGPERAEALALIWGAIEVRVTKDRLEKSSEK